MDNDSISPPSSNPTGAAAARTSSILPTTTTSDDSMRRSGRAEWPTIDGPLGLSHEDSLTYARRFFKLGFLCLPFLWAVNCFYFWPILRHPHADPRLRRSIGFLIFATILSSWALTFAIGEEKVFGSVWRDLVMYNVADKYGLTGWI